MSKFHSILSRRDFMKVLGLTGASLGGAAALTAPVFHDLDEVSSSAYAGFKRPWWISTRPLENPTMEIDWSMMYRSDGAWTGQGAPCATYFLGPTEVAKRSAEGTAFNAAGVKNNTPGLTLRDNALSNGDYQQPTFSFMGPVTATQNPANYGVPAWQGTPEEASNMVRAAMVFYGAAIVGFSEMSTNVKTHMVRQWDKAATHQQYIFEDVPVGYDDGKTKLVLPDNVQLYDFAFLHPLSKEMFRTGPSSAISSAGNSLRYSNMSMIQCRAQIFAATLGYHVYGYTAPTNGIIPTAGMLQFTGLVEQARNSGAMISPEFGSVTGGFSLVTDLPMAPTPPVDAGIFRFCHTCHKCANACPFSAISQDSEPSWEIPNIYGKPDTTHIPGKKQFWTNGIDCWTLKATINSCGTCMGTCTFNGGTNAIHSYVKAAVAKTPMFNSFLWKADSAFGYGMHADKEAWWNLSLPTFGYNTSEVCLSKDY